MSAAGFSRDEFLGARLGRVVLRLKDIASVDGALASVRGESQWMIETRVPADDVTALGRLTARGFRVVDTNVQLDSPAGTFRLSVPGKSAWTVRAACPADRDGVRELCGAEMTTSRFHLDPQIGDAAAASVKRDWVGNFFEGKRGEGLYVVDAASAVAGFLLVIERGTEGIIDLVAVGPAARGSGALRALLTAWCVARPKLERIVVGTQISNTRSLRAYEKLGFRVCGASYVLHRHADQEGSHE
jgi:ribosomal protein S18 acetylase RimI-like enzyme